MHGSTTNTSRPAAVVEAEAEAAVKSPTGGTIVITAPVGNADQHADLHVSISYASGGGGYQTRWAYRIDSAFPAYGSPHGGTQVTGTTSVNDFLSGQANGSGHVVALLDPSGNLHQPARHPRRMDQLPIPSRPAAVVEAEAVDSPPPAEP